MKNLLASFALILLGMVAISSCSNGNKADKAKVNTAAEVKQTTTAGTKLMVDTKASVINWTGSKPAGKHTGTIALKSGEITTKDGEVVGGSFVMDMNSIVCTDLDGDMKANLEAHLKGTGKEDGASDFFNVTKYPTSKFVITKLAKLKGDESGATHIVYGNLTIKDVTKEVGFKATVNKDNAGYLISTPEFSIDRTEWGIKYGSKKFFDDLKDKFINDDINLAIKLQAS